MHLTVFIPRNAILLHSASYRAGPKKLKLECENVDKMREACVAEPVEVKWAFFIVFVQTKNGSTAFCVRFCHLNSVTERNSYPILGTDQYRESLREAKIFSIHDVSQGYRPNKIDGKDTDKTLSSRILNF